jgi:hypothetical protein
MPRRPAFFSLVNLTIVLALACLAALGYKLSPRLRSDAEQTVEPLAGCDLNVQACAAELPGGGRIELSITPRPIPVVSPLRVSAQLVGASADALEIDFAGVSMDMGYQRQRLVADGRGGFSGEAMLPVCVTGRMSWQATLLIDRDARRIAVPFRFAAPGETRR